MFPITDLELASRLSFFLWSQGPDDELLNLAARGKLRQPGVLEKQMRRMLADPRSHALAENFAFQWLNLRDHPRISIRTRSCFPISTQSLKTAFDTRTGAVHREHHRRRPQRRWTCLTADHTFVNERLALHYGIPDIRGDQFRRVTLSDPNRWGLLGKGGILMVTSYPNRTAPVLRGAWILERHHGNAAGGAAAGCRSVQGK